MLVLLFSDPEKAMNERLMERNESSSAVRSGFHPLIYKAAIALVALFVIAAWVAFDRQSDIELPLAILSILLFVAVFLPYLLWRIWRTGQASANTKDQQRLLEMGAGSMKVGQGELRSRDAAIDMLLPLAAVAFGLVALGLAFALS
jgi:hypothetical protein